MHHWKYDTESHRFKQDYNFLCTSLLESCQIFTKSRYKKVNSEVNT